MRGLARCAASRSALFVAAAVAGDASLVVVAAVGAAGRGAVGAVVVFVPGAAHGRIALVPPPPLPHERSLP